MGRSGANMPTVIVKHGQVIDANLDREHMSMTAVRSTVLEGDGRARVIPRRAVPA